MKSPEPVVPEKRVKTAALLCTFVLIAAALIFTRLGHYALWDDESYTALAAKAVWSTGDTSAIVGHNIVAYQNGAVLSNLKDHYSPPLPAYLSAPFLGLLGDTAFTARLAFAFCGIACFSLIAWWLWVERVNFLSCCLIAIGLLGNVSYLLYLRQARYYALAAFLVIAISYLYLRWKGRTRDTILLGLALSALFASNYMTFAVFCVVLAVDFFLWGRSSFRPSFSQWMTLLGIPVVVCLAVGSIWNPFTADIGAERLAGNSFFERLTLLWWNFRDLNICEFASLAILAVSPFLIRGGQGNDPLLRALTALLFFIGLTTLTSPQPVSATSVADIRYLFVLIPLLVFIQAQVLIRIFKKPVCCLAAAAILFGTNILNGGFLYSTIQSTPSKFIGELISPPLDPYKATSQWIQQNVPSGSSVWVLPEYAVAPLIFHAPQATYAWQLKWPPQDQFKHLPPIHFQGRIAPDYIVGFGPFAQRVRTLTQSWEGVEYRELAILDVFWKDLHRPELFWRTFTPITRFDPTREGVIIFQKK